MTIHSSAQSRAVKARGRITEQMLVDYLRDRGIIAERRRLTGTEDCGDIAAGKLVVEVKHGGLRDVPEGFNELAVEITNADRRFPEDMPHTGIVVARRKGKPFVGEWYCALPLERMVDLLLALGFK